VRLRAAGQRVHVAAVVLVLDGAVPFQDQILFDGSDRADLLPGDHARSLPAAILTCCPRQGVCNITAPDAALAGHAFRRDRGRRYLVMADTLDMDLGQALLNENASNAERITCWHPHRLDSVPSVRIYGLPPEAETLLRTERSAAEKGLYQTETSPCRFRLTRRHQ
jgi:hypothetical protein